LKHPEHHDEATVGAENYSSRTSDLNRGERLGFHVRLKTQDGTRGARIGFLRELSSPTEAREVLVEMVRQHGECKQTCDAMFLALRQQIASRFLPQRAPTHPVALPPGRFQLRLRRLLGLRIIMHRDKWD